MPVARRSRIFSSRQGRSEFMMCESFFPTSLFVCVDINLVDHPGFAAFTAVLLHQLMEAVFVYLSEMSYTIIIIITSRNNKAHCFRGACHSQKFNKMFVTEII